MSSDAEVLCGCAEVLTDSVALPFSVPCVSLPFVGALLPDTSGKTMPLQQEDKVPPFFCSHILLKSNFHFFPSAAAAAAA